MKLRVAIQQPTLAKYRNPVFRQLESRGRFALTVYYGSRKTLANVKPEGFKGTLVRLHEFRFLRQLFFFHIAQFYATNPKNFDVAILTWNTRYLSLVPALLLARWRGTPTILWGHAYSKRESGIRSKIRRMVGGLASSLLFYDINTANQFKDQNPTHELVFVAPNAIDQSEVEAAKASLSVDQLQAFQDRESLRGRKVILFCSRLEPRNRLDMLIRALPAIHLQHPSTLLLVIGDEPSYRSELERLVSECGVSDKVRFLGSIYEESKLAPWFLSADVFCYPENIGLSLLHAFGYGLPVVTGNAVQQQNPEIAAFQDGFNGIFYETGSQADLEEKLCSLLGNQALQKQLSRNATITATEKYTIESMVEGMSSAIERTVECLG